MNAPDPIDVSKGDGPWPGFTVTGLTGNDGGFLGDYFITCDDTGFPVYRNFIFPDDSFVHVTEGIWAIGSPGADFYTADAVADWPWQVASWTVTPGGAGGSPVFEYLLTAPFGIPVWNGDPLVAARLHVYGDESSLNSISQLTAVTPGTSGNSIRYAQVKQEANNLVASIVVSGRDITFKLGTDSSGNSNTTANARNALINADPAASKLIVATNYMTGNGTGIANSTYVLANLTGGKGLFPDEPSPLPVTGAETNNSAILFTSDTTSNAKAILTAVPAGRIGNSIRYRQVDPGRNNATASVVVDGFDITINLATGSGGAVTTTGTQRNALITASPEASALITADTLTGNTGAGIVSAFAFANLTGGFGGLAPAPESLPL